MSIKMIPYYEQLKEEEQEKVSGVIQTLLKQTYLLEWKYDKYQKRMQINPNYYICDQHLEFIKEYFSIIQIEVREDSFSGLIYLDGGEQQIGSKLTEYTTKFILILKLLYDEQMAMASNSSSVITTRAEVQNKMAGFQLLTKQPLNGEVRAAFTFLKKYQIIDFIDKGEELELNARFLIYPTIHALLKGEDIRKLVETYCIRQEETKSLEKEENFKTTESLETEHSLEEAENLEEQKTEDLETEQNLEEIEGLEAEQSLEDKKF